MGLRHAREEPSEANTPFVWINIRVKQEAEERARNAPHKPYVSPIPESWTGKVLMALCLIVMFRLW